MIIALCKISNKELAFSIGGDSDDWYRTRGSSFVLEDISSGKFAVVATEKMQQN